MSTKSSRASPSPSSPTTSNHGPKLPRFLKTNRDRSKSMLDPAGSPIPSSSSSSSSSPAPPETPKHKKSSRRGSILRDAGSRRQSQDVDPGDVSVLRDGEDTPDEPPVIVEPSSAPRPRTRSERPLSDNYPSAAYYSPGSSTRLTDLPTRLSGWFAHTFSNSSTDLSLPSLLSQQHLSASVSPKGKGSALLTAARHSKGHLDKAMRYLLDSDAMPDKCPEPIWLLGVQHPGFEPAPLAPDLHPSPARRSSADSRRGSGFRSSTSSPGSPNSTPPDPSLSQSQPPSSSTANHRDIKDPSKNWPPVFYADFTSRIWLTYRSQFFPIRDTTLAALEAEVHESSTGLPSSPPTKRWNWLGGEKGWTSDAGWGCMLRTGQSLLANALLHLHLGREWRRPPHPVYTADYATYVQIVTWFLDTPSPLCPFSVHRMALVGKDLGKDVGQWFGPSTAAGAIKTLVHKFPDAGLGVAVATDSTLYESDVYGASRSAVYSTRRHGHGRMEWGDRAVLVLIGIRLGIEGVNPLYYNTIKTLYTFPQTVGIAGGRPSSSYYFVGSQADNLFYLDPHHARPAIPLRPPTRASTEAYERQSSPEAYGSDREREKERQYRTLHHVRSPTSPVSIRSDSSAGSASSFSYRSPTLQPSPLQQQLSTSSASTSHSDSSQSHNNMHTRWQSASVLPDESAEMDSRELGLGTDLDTFQRHLVTAYSQAELRTFHCDRVRKMPLSGLDPSMLLGFLCKDEGEWLDLKDRITELFRTNKSIFSLANEPPHYPSDSDDMGLESISEPDIDMPDDDEFSLGNSPAGSMQDSAPGGSVKSEVDTEEDPIAPLTPSAGKPSFDIDPPERMKRAPSNQSTQDSLSFDDEDDEEWADPPEFSSPHLPLVEPVPVARGSSSPEMSPVIAATRSTNSTASRDTTGTGKTTRRKAKKGSSGGNSTRAARSSQQAEAQVQYPFPAGDPEDEEPEPPPTAQMQGKRVPQMRTAKARDGGRTQSGGIKGILMDDADDF